MARWTTFDCCHRRERLASKRERFETREPQHLQPQAGNALPKCRCPLAHHISPYVYCCWGKNPKEFLYTDTVRTYILERHVLNSSACPDLSLFARCRERRERDERGEGARSARGDGCRGRRRARAEHVRRRLARQIRRDGARATGHASMFGMIPETTGFMMSSGSHQIKS